MLATTVMLAEITRIWSIQNPLPEGKRQRIWHFWSSERYPLPSGFSRRTDKQAHILRDCKARFPFSLFFFSIYTACLFPASLLPLSVFYLCSICVNLSIYIQIAN